MDWIIIRDWLAYIGAVTSFGLFVAVLGNAVCTVDDTEDGYVSDDRGGSDV